MIKASALYMVIVMALVIAVLCSSLIVVAYFYRIQYQQKFRYDQLQNNLGSAVNIILGSEQQTLENEKTFSLFGGDHDSVTVKKTAWGIYDIGVAKAFIQRDTLYKSFSVARMIDSTKWAALYLIDEDRPLSVSGKTLIKGNAFIPKSGIREAYIDGKSYEGDKRIVIGQKHNSAKELPSLDDQILQKISAQLIGAPTTDSLLLRQATVSNSFFKPTRTVNLKKTVTTLSNISLTGNIILHSDTLLIIDSTVHLHNVLIFAKAISIKSGFHGTCQLFATDSISAERDCRFDYPSCMGIVRQTIDKNAPQAKIALGENGQLNGVIFICEKVKPVLSSMIDLGKNTVISGQVYAQGMLNLKPGITINGSMMASRFLYQSSYTRYENYLVGVTLNAPALSPYYLTSSLMPVAQKKNKVLQWLETN